jgi:hypothetical protein
MLLLVALALSAATTTAPPPAKKICPMSRIEYADNQQRPRIVQLGAMPPAKHIKAVLRRVDGCEKPIVVSEEVGIIRR